MNHKGIFITDQRPVPQRRTQSVHGDNVSPCLPQFSEQRKFLCSQGRLFTVPAFRPLSPVDLSPVSYTHLDVYKRQGLNNAVKAGKVRYIGISNCFAWQLAKANALAEREGFAKFVSVQGHYNLIFREEEREMRPYCREEHIAMTPYSPLAGGRLSKRPGDTPKRLQEDSYCLLYTSRCV